MADQKLNDLAAARWKKLPKALKDMGFKALKPHQLKPLQNTLMNKDQVVILPTGGGKSALYIIPTLCAGWKTLIFSPLIALIKDQLEALQSRGLRAGAVCSAYSPTEISMTMNEWLSGSLDFLFIAPERLDDTNFIKNIIQNPPDMVVVDEIHVASEHSDNFRPTYRKIAEFTKDMGANVFLGLTATMPVEVEEDLRTIFNLTNAEFMVSWYERKNLHMRSKAFTNTESFFRDIAMLEGSTIIYYSTVKKLEEEVDIARNTLTGGVDVYHGQLHGGKRETAQNLFMNGRIKTVLATNAFGMGINKSNIRNVVFRTYPSCLEEWIQGVGRAGRDDKDSECWLYLEKRTLDTQEFFLSIKHPPKSEIYAFYDAIKRHMDGEGLCRLTLKDICDQAGFHTSRSGSISAILTGSGVMERITVGIPLKIKILQTPVAENKYLSAVKKYGVINTHRYHEIDLDFLAQQAGTTVATVKNNLKLLHSSGIVDYVPPSNVTKPIKLVGDISRVDFPRLQKKRNDAKRKLQELIDFGDLPDEEKPAYVKDYFLKEFKRT